jgi:hypothetical protein
MLACSAAAITWRWSVMIVSLRAIAFSVSHKAR